MGILERVKVLERLSALWPVPAIVFRDVLLSERATINSRKRFVAVLGHSRPVHFVVAATIVSMAAVPIARVIASLTAAAVVTRVLLAPSGGVFEALRSIGTLGLIPVGRSVAAGRRLA
jgi:hypothetical protein